MAAREAEPVQRVEAYCVVPPGQPVPGHVAVGHVISVQPNSHPIVPSFGMPHAEVTVAALKSEWPFPHALLMLHAERLLEGPGPVLLRLLLHRLRPRGDRRDERHRGPL